MLADYEYFVRETNIKFEIGKQRVVSIGIRHKIDGYVGVSPLTNFLIRNYGGDSPQLNTVKAPAYVITRFMNFIHKKIDEEDPAFTNLRNQGLIGITLQHGNSFLTYHSIIKGNNRNTVESYRQYLSDFYVFLKLQGLTTNYSLQDGYVKTRYGQKKKKWVDFNDAPEPPIIQNKDNQKIRYKKLKDFGDNRTVMVSEFLGVAKQLYPEIAFGIALMFYGGLRRGEVVNLNRKSILYKKGEKCIVEIRDRQQLLFSHIKSNSNNEVKIPRDQVILINPLLDDLYEQHLKIMKHKLCNNKQALFINSNGDPITGSNLGRKFKKIRMRYEYELSNNLNRRDDYDFIKGITWSNHIGRGVFTNFLLSMGIPLTEIAIARGDTSPHSLLSYVEELNAQAALREASEILGQIYTQYKQRFKNEELDSVKIEQAFKEGAANIEPKAISTFKELYTKA